MGGGEGGHLLLTRARLTLNVCVSTCCMSPETSRRCFTRLQNLSAVLACSGLIVFVLWLIKMLLNVRLVDACCHCYLLVGYDKVLSATVRLKFKLQNNVADPLTWTLMVCGCKVDFVRNKHWIKLIAVI